MSPTAKVRGRFGSLITEAAVVGDRGKTFETRVKNHLWTEVDDDEPLEHMEPGKWNPHVLDKALLWELAGLGTTPGSDATLETELLRELSNRQKVWALMYEAVTAAQGGGTPPPFTTQPLAAAIAKQCTKSDGSDIDLKDLMHILHMFGDKSSPKAPRPKDSIKDEDYFYSTEDEVAIEVRRRVRELATGIPWEGNVTGGHEIKKSGVWNRYGFYCGCGG